MDANPGSCADLIINGTLTWTNTRTLNVSGNLSISNGTVSGNVAATLNVTGTFTVPISTTAAIQQQERPEWSRGGAEEIR